MQQGATQGCFPPSGLVAGLRGCRRRAYPPHCSIPAGLSSLASCRSGSAASGSELQRRDPPAARPPPLPPRSLPHAAPRTARRPGCTVPGSLFQLAGDRGSPRAWRVQTGECHARAPVAFPCQSLRVSGCPGLGGPPCGMALGVRWEGGSASSCRSFPAHIQTAMKHPQDSGWVYPQGRTSRASQSTTIACPLQHATCCSPCGDPAGGVPSVISDAWHCGHRQGKSDAYSRGAGKLDFRAISNMRWPKGKLIPKA